MCQTIRQAGENEDWCTSVFLHMPTKSGLIIFCNCSSWKDDVRNPIYNVWAKSVLN